MNHTIESCTFSLGEALGDNQDKSRFWLHICTLEIVKFQVSFLKFSLIQSKLKLVTVPHSVCQCHLQMRNLGYSAGYNPVL